ncbi:MAG TPA: hypothetical protein VJB68_06825, partial [Methylophilaceae bacterium]|nr:hypothetical protein [Methylophilaceae bacterium]
MKLPGGWRGNSARHLSVMGLYLAVTLVMTLPVANTLTSQIIGEGGDPWQTMWRFEYKYEALVNAATAGDLGLFLRQEFWGGGEPRLMNLSVWPWMPIYAALGNPQGYNVVWLLSFFLTGYSAYLLLRWSLQEYAPTIVSPAQREWAAIIAGLYYMLLPYHVAHSLGHFGAMQLQWLPLLFLALGAWLKRPAPGRTMALAALFTMQVWIEHHYALWFVVAALLWVGWQRRDIARAWRQAAFRQQLFVLLVLLFGITLPSILPTLRLAAADTVLTLGAAQTTRFSAD